MPNEREHRWSPDWRNRIQAYERYGRSCTGQSLYSHQVDCDERSEHGGRTRETEEAYKIRRGYIKLSGHLTYREMEGLHKGGSHGTSLWGYELA